MRSRTQPWPREPPYPEASGCSGGKQEAPSFPCWLFCSLLPAAQLTRLAGYPSASSRLACLRRPLPGAWSALSWGSRDPKLSGEGSREGPRRTTEALADLCPTSTLREGKAATPLSNQLQNVHRQARRQLQLSSPAGHGVDGETEAQSRQPQKAKPGPVSPSLGCHARSWPGSRLRSLSCPGVDSGLLGPALPSGDPGPG